MRALPAERGAGRDFERDQTCGRGPGRLRGGVRLPAVPCMPSTLTTALLP